jgi:hypothetical protein
MGEQIKILFGGGTNWTLLLQMANKHGATPLLYWRLSSNYADLVPRAVLNKLQDHYRNNTRRNFILTGELLAFLRLFDANGIPAIPFKGLTLAAAVYPDLALRDIGDLDLLIRKRDMAKAAELLLGQGYQPMFKLNCAQEAAHLASIGQLPFVRNQGAGIVELHTTLMPRQFAFALDFNRVWERRVTVSLGGQEVPSLCPEDLLLVLCAHASKHQWECLRWICDIAYLLHRHREINWECVLREAHRLASRRMLFLGLFLAKELLRASIPQEIWQRVRTDAAVKSLAAGVIRDLFDTADRKLGGFRSAWFHLRARERLRDGIRYSTSLALTPTLADYDFQPLLPRFFILYHLIRPIRLAGRYAQKLSSRFCVGNASR